MKNYGKAECKVELGNSLPFYSKDLKITNFEVSARMWDKIISESSYFRPMLAEHLTDNRKSFEVIYPAKRKQYVNNYLDGGGYIPPTEADDYFIYWKPLKVDGGDNSLGVIKDISKEYKYFDFYMPDSAEEEDPSDSVSDKPPANAATWINTSYEAQPAPSDIPTIQDNIKFFKAAGSPIPDPQEFVIPSNALQLPQLGYINQTNALDGLFYCAESELFLSDNMPFWISLKRTPASPSGWEHETMIIISLGVSDGSSGDGEGGAAQSYDLILRNNSKPELVDY